MQKYAMQICKNRIWFETFNQILVPIIIILKDLNPHCTATYYIKH